MSKNIPTIPPSHDQLEQTPILPVSTRNRVILGIALIGWLAFLVWLYRINFA
jgi:hypothetical protein